MHIRGYIPINICTEYIQGQNKKLNFADHHDERRGIATTVSYMYVPRVSYICGATPIMYEKT